MPQTDFTDVFLSALEPSKYIKLVSVLIGSYFAACKIDSIWARVMGIATLVALGGMILLTGLSNGELLDILIGLLSVGGALHAWWVTRV